MRRSDGWGRLSLNTTVEGSGASMPSTLAYQSLRALSRSLVGASGASRTTSKVYFTSREVKGRPSCHFTFFLRKNTTLRSLPCHDQRSASSGITVSTLSCGLAGSKRTRFEEHGDIGHTLDTVADSWMSRPGGSSMGSVLRMPPRLGVWPWGWTGPAPPPTAEGNQGG